MQVKRGWEPLIYTGIRANFATYSVHMTSSFEGKRRVPF
jgi:hypothetical protein